MPRPSHHAPDAAPPTWSAVAQAQREMLPLLGRLCAVARQEARPDQEAFFQRIRTGLQHARFEDDLVGPFLELSTAAFRGFAFSAAAERLLDRTLALAHDFSATLSASSKVAH